MFMYRNYMKINTLQFIIISLIKLYVILIILIIYMYANNIRIYIHDATIRSKDSWVPEIPGVPGVIKFKYLDFLTNKKDIYYSVKQNKSYTEDADHNVVISNVIKNVNENVVFRFLLSSYFAYYLYNTQNRVAHPQSTINTRVCFILPPNFSYF